MATTSNPSANVVNDMKDMNLDILENLKLKQTSNSNANQETKITGGLPFAQEIK